MSSQDGIYNPDAHGEGWQPISNTLPQLGILSMMSPQALTTLSGYGTYGSFRGGEIVIAEGVPQDKFYVVVDGLLEVYVTVDGQTVTLAQVDAGECLGEAALLTPGPAVASVVTLQDAVLWSMDAAALTQYLSQHVGGGGTLLMGMAQCLSQRLRSANQQIMEHCDKPQLRVQAAVKAIHAPTQNLKKGLFSGLFGSSPSDKKVKIRTEIKL
jgi:CRP/FNR family transcriptional regulator, cyclic AMP receptor protein